MYRTKVSEGGLFMTSKQQLMYLMCGLLSGKYSARAFCEEFTRIYDFEIDINTLSSEEIDELGELSDMASRFSDYKEDLAIPNVFCDEKSIRKKVCDVKKWICSSQKKEEYI